MECSEAVYTYKLYLDTVVFWELENLEHKQVESILHWWSQLISSLKRSERNNFMKNRNSFVDSLTLEFYLFSELLHFFKLLTIAIQYTRLLLMHNQLFFCIFIINITKTKKKYSKKLILIKITIYHLFYCTRTGTSTLKLQI